MTNVEPAVSIDSVSKRFGEHLAVDGLNLTVPGGSIYGFIGPNGSGKTTTLRMILGMIEPESGSIHVMGRLAGKVPVREIGYLPEERGMYRKMRIDRQLTYFARLKGMSAKEIQPEMQFWLKRFDLMGWELKKIEALSKGMAQKIQFIAAVIARPKLLILDEPFSGLDPVNQEVLREAILELRAAGTTIIFSTHDMYVAERMCDRVFMIYRGRKVLDGALGEIREQFGMDTIKLALEGGNFDPVGLEGVTSARNMGRIWEIRFQGDPQTLLQASMQHGKVQHFEIVHPTLQDIFVRYARPTEDLNAAV